MKIRYSFQMSAKKCSTRDIRRHIDVVGCGCLVVADSRVVGMGPYEVPC